MALYGLLTLGERRARAGDVAGAREAFRSAARAAPRDARVPLQHALAIAPADPAGAVGLGQKAVSLAARAAPAHAILARLAASSRRYDVAARAASESLRLDPANKLAPTVLAWALAGQGNWGAAIERLVRGGVFEDSAVRSRVMLLLLARWRELGPVHPPVPPGFEPPSPAATPPAGASARRAPRRTVAAISRAFYACDPAEMLCALGRLSREAPGCAEIPLGWAAVLHLFGFDQQAEPWTAAARRNDRGEAHADPEGLLLAARIYAGVGELKRAAGLAERASATANPFDRWEARLVLADVREREGQHRDAEGEARAALGEEPLAFGPALARVALHGVLESLRRAIGVAETAGASPLARACRREMGLILGDLGPRLRSPRLARALAGAFGVLPEDLRERLALYARQGIRSALEAAR